MLSAQASHAPLPPSLPLAQLTPPHLVGVGGGDAAIHLNPGVHALHVGGKGIVGSLGRVDVAVCTAPS